MIDYNLDYNFTLKSSLECGLLLDRILSEHQDNCQMNKDHEKPINTKFSHRPAMYMHAFAPTVFTFAFLELLDRLSINREFTVA